jgi:hypothetical protein
LQGYTPANPDVQGVCANKEKEESRKVNESKVVILNMAEGFGIVKNHLVSEASNKTLI